MNQFDLNLLYELIGQRRRSYQIPVNKAKAVFGISCYANKEARRNSTGSRSNNGFTLEEYLNVCEKLNLDPIKLLQIAKIECPKN